MIKEPNKQKCILVVGNFDLLHPGHIRLLKFAKECGDKLVVAVNRDSIMKVESRVKEVYRLEMITSLECVDHAFLTTDTATELVEKLMPDAVVKGKEFEDKSNSELQALVKYGGKLIFGSGEFETNAEHFLHSPVNIGANFDYSESKKYALRHNIIPSDFSDIFKRISELNVVVIGEVIVDEYVQGTAVGLSQEDPTIVMTPNKTDKFLGGAAITAGHIKAIGAKNVSLISIVGNDNTAAYVKQHISSYNIEPTLFTDDSRPTPLKTRYRAGNKTLLRVNQVRQHKISKDLQNEIFNSVESTLRNADLLVFSDFNYGVLPQALVERIISSGKSNKIKIVADSQTSSQVGDISRYKNIDLITPTEREVRVSLNNPDDGLVILAQKLTKISQPENLVITLGDEGILIHLPNKEFDDWESDRLPALNRNAQDPAGAGDCFLAASSLALTANASPWLAFYLGSIAAACQVDSLGNTPLTRTVLQKVLTDSLG